MHQLGFAAAFVIVISQHYHSRNPQTNQRVQERLHFRRLAEVGEVAGKHEQVSVIAHLIELIAQRAVALSGKVQIGGGSDSH